MPKILSLDRHMEEIYSVSLDGQKCCDSNRADIDKMKEMLVRAMNNTLTEKQYLCMTMYFFEGKNMRKIAEELSLNPSTVCRHIKASMKKLEMLRLLVE